MPSNTILKPIKALNKSSQKIKVILDVADYLALVTKKEKKLISKLHSSKMTKNWNHLEDFQFARRTKLCNMFIRKEKISVEGGVVKVIILGKSNFKNEKTAVNHCTEAHTEAAKLLYCVYFPSRKLHNLGKGKIASKRLIVVLRCIFTS